jgi:hypothetical protein
MATIVRAYPLLPGKEQKLAEFLREVREVRRDETSAFFQGLGVRRESWHLQHTERGPIVIVATELDNVDASESQYQAADSAFDQWFKSRVLELSGYDPNRTPLGPPSQQIFQWSEQPSFVSASPGDEGAGD